MSSLFYFLSVKTEFKKMHSRTQKGSNPNEIVKSKKGSNPNEIVKSKKGSNPNSR